MELLCKEKYDGPMCSLLVGQTTVGMELPAEEKARLLADFPEWFEVTDDSVEVPAEVKEVEAEELPVETPEDSLVIETPEAKMDKPRKK